MALGEAPLLQRPQSQNSADDGLGAEQEEDALLTGEPTSKQTASRPSARRRWREFALFAWAFVATTAVVVLAVIYQHARSEHPSTPDRGHGSGPPPTGKRNLIFMVSDGMGPTSLALTRSWRQHVDAMPWDAETLVLDRHLIGQSRTRSSDSLVTDSAAGATAFSCALKSYNGAISVLPDHSPCPSVMEAAKLAGYTTGLVVTTRITDATPAVFASHVRKREMEDNIALQMLGHTHPLGRVVDLMLGGGRCHFLPNSSDASCRADALDPIAIARDAGWDYISTRREFDNLGTTVKLPLLGLFAPTDIPYEIDRRSEADIYPSLEETTKTALGALADASRDSAHGFFVMIEGSRIDHAGHANDAAAQVHEVLAYDRALAAALDFAAKSTVPTLLVATSDHETGGLATARQLHSSYPDYLWYPGVLANASRSAAHSAHALHAFLRRDPRPSPSETESFLRALAADDAGIHDPTPPELASLAADPDAAPYVFADMVARRAQIGWSTHGHSGADVNIYSSDPGLAADLVGNVENTAVGEFLRKFLGVEDELKRVADKLRRQSLAGTVVGVVDGTAVDAGGDAWLGPVPGQGERLDGQDHLDHYHGDHRKRGCGMCAV